MNKPIPLLGCLALLALPGHVALAQAPAEKILVVSPAVGEVIDGVEKAHFGLFPYYSANDFQEARFMRALAPDSAITLRTTFRDGRHLARPFTPAEFAAVSAGIARRLQEVGPLGGLPAPPPYATTEVPPGNGRVASPAAKDAGGTTPELIGRSYSVELLSGNRFTGILRAATAQELEFETKDLGSLHIQRSNLREFVLLTTAQARHGYDDVGNGNRLFFAPTARNLRRGEGYVQNMEVFLLSANYGITDNFSMGAIATVVPGAGSDNVFGITPKASFGLSDKVKAGGGALLLFSNGSTGGITYANATYGGADHNLTGGLGYGFASGIGFSNTPVIMLGGATRIARRVSLVDETYILRDGNSYDRATLVAGIIGMRFAAPRISGALGMLYAHLSYEDPYHSGRSADGGGYPYAELTVRFGKLK
ncbi:hypothetical protein [Hymenobacter ruber]